MRCMLAAALAACLAASALASPLNGEQPHPLAQFLQVAHPPMHPACSCKAVNGEGMAPAGRTNSTWPRQWHQQLVANTLPRQDAGMHRRMAA